MCDGIVSHALCGGSTEGILNRLTRRGACNGVASHALGITGVGTVGQRMDVQT